MKMKNENNIVNETRAKLLTDKETKIESKTKQDKIDQVKATSNHLLSPIICYMSVSY